MKKFIATAAVCGVSRPERRRVWAGGRSSPPAGLARIANRRGCA
jgi:hypothetical protein